MSRRTAREHVLQALYQLEFHPEEHEAVVRERGEDLQGEDHSFYLRLFQGVQQKREVIDPLIQRFLKKGWSLSRISSVDRSILRIAAYELLFEKETPQGAILNEAVDLAKVFSSEESSRFINGVLGAMLSQLEQIDAELENKAK